MKITANIEGMACPMCEKHMREAIEKNLNGKDVTASHTEKKATFTTDTEVTVEIMKKTVEDAGYKFVGMDIE